ncbi:Transport protein particle subunit trs120 [Erysiphe neolycopersici]|uniref:Transport protein particle subunit trs120 n=1 Tax=Erysiphe neolycopersici TaxID=212602 RepID=A0A420I5R5_9PEZI|nr:Transport protein particle subunit trs120 [Erysiphe neolycopersici]
MLDQFSPAAPARVRVVLFPLGKIKRPRFSSFVERLQQEHIVRLGDISPDGRPHLNMFSPLAFPVGMIVYDLTTFYPSYSCIALSPFELHREPIVIIGVADAAEIEQNDHDGNNLYDAGENQRERVELYMNALDQDFKYLKERYYKAILHRIILFDYVPQRPLANLPEDIITVPPLEDCKRTTLKTIMCDISSRLLADMTILAKSIQESKSLKSVNSLRQGQEVGRTAINIDQKFHVRESSDEKKASGNSGESSSLRFLDRNHSRTSMPIFKKDSRSSSASGRPKIPINYRPSSSNSAAENNSNGSQDSTQNTQRMVINRFHSASATSDKSSDRNTIMGFGSGSFNENAVNIEKCRKIIMIGSLYMLAGRWTDAIKEMAEGATIAKNIFFHLWHAKALENILVSILMLAWCGLNFQIPQVCYDSSEKTYSTQSLQDGKLPTQSRMTSLQQLNTHLPEILDKILNIYSMATKKIGQAIPQIPYSESVVRFSKLLTAIHLNGGYINDDVLKLAVLGVPLQVTPNVSIPRVCIRPTRSEIVAILFQAFPSASSESLPTVDMTIILSTIASILTSLGYRRKRALVIRELVTHLIQGLVHARINGAIETDIPNVSCENGDGKYTLNLNPNDIEFGIDKLLGSLGKSYGIVSSSIVTSPDGIIDDSNEAIALRILQNASLRAFGNYRLKIDVLRSCINMSEALPDCHFLLRFTADLLRTVGSGVAPGPRSQNASPSMSREEQLTLASKISRTLTVARNLGVGNLETEYWDEFLVRGVELEPTVSSKRPIFHKHSELPGATINKTPTARNPFIYNPFSRTDTNPAIDQLLVADETASFKVTLQNPFEFEVEVESMELESEGVEFESVPQKLTIGPYRTQTVSISGIPKVSGRLKITGCVIKVRGCRIRRFPIFEEPWSPQREVKVDSIGVASVFKSEEPRKSLKASANTPPPKPNYLLLNVIKKQPIIVVKGTTLTQSSLSILEGETRVFSITLQNLSSVIPVDLLLFSFSDSTEGPLQEVLKSRDSAAAEQYECELNLAQKQALRWKMKDNEIPSITSGGTVTFDIEVFGKPGLTNAIVRIDYAYLGVPTQDVMENFYTRQIKIPLSITVSTSVQLESIDIIPLSGSIPRSIWARARIMLDENFPIESDDYFLLQLDLRNAWSDQLSVRLQVKSGGLIEKKIPSGVTKRFIFPMNRIFIKNTSAPIPSLDPTRQRQFVVSTNKLSDENERNKREIFWYREELLKLIQGSWSYKTNSRKNGIIELRSIKLNPRMIEAIRVDEISIQLSIESQHGTKAELFTDKFTELKVRISNKTTKSITPILRLMVSIRNQPQHLALDLGKRLVVNGLQQQILPTLLGTSYLEISYGIIALARGEYEINASVEETYAMDSSKESLAPNENSSNSNANNDFEIQTSIESKERRIWHSKKPLLILVQDKNTVDDDDE